MEEVKIRHHSFLTSALDRGEYTRMCIRPNGKQNFRFSAMLLFYICHQYTISSIKWKAFIESANLLIDIMLKMCTRCIETLYFCIYLIVYLFI